MASQEWHRDPEDQHVVKVFLYFSDVDEDAGPLRVRAAAAPSGVEYGDLWPWGESGALPADRGAGGGRSRPETADARPGRPGRSSSATRAASTAAASRAAKPRILSTHTYVNRKITPERPERRKFTVDWRDGELSEDSRFALS